MNVVKLKKGPTEDYWGSQWPRVYEEKLRDVDFFSLLKRRLSSDLTEVCKYLNESYKVVQTNSLVLGAKINNHKNWLRRFGLLMRKKSFTRQIVQTWNRLYRFKTQPNKAIAVLIYCLLLAVEVLAVGDWRKSSVDPFNRHIYDYEALIHLPQCPGYCL